MSPCAGIFMKRKKTKIDRPRKELKILRVLSRKI